VDGHGPPPDIRDIDRKGPTSSDLTAEGLIHLDADERLWRGSGTDQGPPVDAFVAALWDPAGSTTRGPDAFAGVYLRMNLRCNETHYR
jgi:hypothetical protein